MMTSSPVGGGGSMCLKCMNECMNEGNKFHAPLFSPFKCQLETSRGTSLSLLADVSLSSRCHALMLRAMCGEALALICRGTRETSQLCIEIYTLPPGSFFSPLFQFLWGDRRRTVASLLRDGVDCVLSWCSYVLLIDRCDSQVHLICKMWATSCKMFEFSLSWIFVWLLVVIVMGDGVLF